MNGPRHPSPLARHPAGIPRPFSNTFWRLRSFPRPLIFAQPRSAPVLELGALRVSAGWEVPSMAQQLFATCGPGQRLWCLLLRLHTLDSNLPFRALGCCLTPVCVWGGHWPPASVCPSLCPPEVRGLFLLHPSPTQSPSLSVSSSQFLARPSRPDLTPHFLSSKTRFPSRLSLSGTCQLWPRAHMCHFVLLFLLLLESHVCLAGSPPDRVQVLPSTESPP